MAVVLPAPLTPRKPKISFPDREGRLPRAKGLTKCFYGILVALRSGFTSFSMAGGLKMSLKVVKFRPVLIP